MTNSSAMLSEEHDAPDAVIPVEEVPVTTDAESEAEAPEEEEETAESEQENTKAERVDKPLSHTGYSEIDPMFGPPPEIKFTVSSIPDHTTPKTGFFGKLFGKKQ